MDCARRSVMHVGRFLISLALLLCFAVFPQPIGAEEQAEFVPNEVMMKLVEGTDPYAVALTHNLRIMDQFGQRPIYRMQIVDGSPPPEKAAALANDPEGRVLFAEPNYFGQTPEGGQKSGWSKGIRSSYGKQWVANVLRLPQAHSVTRGADVTVAVLDTGVDPNHPVLTGKLVNGYDFVDADSDPSEVGSNMLVTYGHGTHVAGLVALAAPRAKIMPLRVLDPNGVGNIWVLIEALNYAVNPDGDLATADGAEVINLSLSFARPSDLLEDIIEEVTCADDDVVGCGDDDDDDGRGDNDVGCGGDDDDDDGRDDDDDGRDDDDVGCGTPPSPGAPTWRGAVVVAAAGNNGASTPEYPAAENVAGLLAVAASTQRDRLAGFSNHGSWVHIAAPGENVVSSVPGGGYGSWSGTSMATPLAAGTAALIRSFEPELSTADVAARLMSTAAPINSLVPLRIDAAAALGLPR